MEVERLPPGLVVIMEFPEYPPPDVLVARLVRGPARGREPAQGAVSLLSPGQPPTEGYLRRLAQQVGMHSYDLFLVANLPVPNDALLFDEEAGHELPALVRGTLALPASGRQRLRECARSQLDLRRTMSPRRQRPYEQYPPGFGSLLVRMLALRNLDWPSAAKVMLLMSGVYVAAATIGAVGRGVRELDAELLTGFAAVLGVPAVLLESLTGIDPASTATAVPAEISDTAALLWDVRQLTAEQVRQVAQLAGP
ncbi:hypothetical protein [Nonomuraea typhae]|uniref:Uncharacterized protein n=1 Tax=Nonomuraea typhae TaxID=2603600 RepID=A0ABW7YXA0_9ACTN